MSRQRQIELPETYRTADRDAMRSAIVGLKKRLGERLLILAHHYQTDDVHIHGDATGDSLELSRRAAAVQSPELKYIVFCGVRFMAETADILAPDGSERAVILPHLDAGCSMAAMANADDADRALGQLIDLNAGKRIIPVTYVNSSAEIKAFVGRNDGVCCTSGNASAVLKWALSRGGQVLFLPDEHLGRNTAIELGVPPDRIALYDQRALDGATDDDAIRRATVVLWKGFCLLHQLFTPDDVLRARANDPSAKIIVHPECSREVVALSDQSGSTAKIIKIVEASEPGSRWVVGTEANMVARLARAQAARGVSVRSLSDRPRPCVTMQLTTAPYLWYVLDRLANGEIVNRISVDPAIRADARIALERMLELG